MCAEEDARAARTTELERRVHVLEAQVQSKDRQIAAWKNRFREDCQEMRRNRARIAELEEQLVEVTEDRDGFHGMTIALDEQLATVTTQRDEALEADAAHQAELAGMTAQRNHAVETLLAAENQLDELALLYDGLIGAHHDLLHEHEELLDQHEQLEHQMQQMQPQAAGADDAEEVSGVDYEPPPTSSEEEDAESDADSHAPPA